MPKQSEVLKAAIASRTADTNTLRVQHAKLIDGLAVDPHDEHTHVAIAKVESALAKAAASIGSLEQALEQAIAREHTAGIAAARQASEGTRQAVIAALTARAKLAERVDAAGAALVKALHDLREQSKSIAAGAAAVIAARAETPEQAGDRHAVALPGAAATSQDFALAMSNIVRRLVAEIGPAAVEKYIAVNDYVPKGGTFIAADAAARITVESALQ